MNQVEITYQDKKNRQAGIKLNGQYLGLGMISKPSGNGFDQVNYWSVSLANIHNQSNPIRFEARSLQALAQKIPSIHIN